MKKIIPPVAVILTILIGAGLYLGYHQKPALAPAPTQTTQKQPTQTLKPTEPHRDLPGNPTNQQFFALTNADRAANNLPALTYDARLEHSAQLKCADMVANHYFAHNRGQGTFVFFPSGAAAEGENLEQGVYTPTRIEQAWMASPEHRANILGNYDSVGFAECGDLVVEHFVLWPAISKGGL
jgi:uncharacterized protein YkwD